MVRNFFTPFFFIYFLPFMLFFLDLDIKVKKLVKDHRIKLATCNIRTLSEEGLELADMMINEEII